MKEMVGGCCVCSDERGWPENPLVYCDGVNCTVAVHQACYGIVTVPTGPWYCRKCESQERSARVRCELCPSRDGALKKTDNQGWAHVVCALYIPEVRFGNVTTMEPIILQLIPAERYAKPCYICQDYGKGNRATVGACMQCNKSGCKQQFHVTCAQGLGLLCEEAGNYLDNVKYCGYCQHHYSKLKKGGNVKTIPPYKPVTHESASSDGISSPEKELEPPSTASQSTVSVNMKSNPNQSASGANINSSSSSSSSSSKQRKSGSSKMTSSSSSSLTSNNPGGNVAVSTASNAPSSTSTSSSSKTSSSSSASKDKDKHSKSLNKISSSSKNIDKDSTSNSSTRDKSKSSKNSSKDMNLNLEHGSGSSSGISSANVSASSISSSGSQSVGSKDSFNQKFAAHNFNESVVMNSEQLFGNSGEKQSSSSPNTGSANQQVSSGPSSNRDTKNSASSSSSTSNSGGSGGGGSAGKKRKADSSKFSSSTSSSSGLGGTVNSTDLLDLNNHPRALRDIIKDVSVTLIPLPMSKMPDVSGDMGSHEKVTISKKPKTEISSTSPHQDNNAYSNSGQNMHGGSGGSGLTIKTQTLGQTTNSGGVGSTQQSSLNVSNSTSSSSQSHIKPPILKDVVVSDSRTRSSSPYNSSTVSSNSSGGGTPSLYVSVPLSNANVPGVNLPSTTANDHVTPSSRSSSHVNHSHHQSNSSLSSQQSIIERQSPRISQNNQQQQSSLHLNEHSSSNSSSLHSSTVSLHHSSSMSPSMLNQRSDPTPMDTGGLKITYEKQNPRVSQLQEDLLPARRSRRSQSGDSGSKSSRSGKKRSTAANAAASITSSSSMSSSSSTTLAAMPIGSNTEGSENATTVPIPTPPPPLLSGSSKNPVQSSKFTESTSTNDNHNSLSGKANNSSSSSSSVVADQHLPAVAATNGSGSTAQNAKQLNKKMLRAQQSQQQQQQKHTTSPPPPAQVSQAPQSAAVAVNVPQQQQPQHTPPPRQQQQQQSSSSASITSSTTQIPSDDTNPSNSTPSSNNSRTPDSANLSILSNSGLAITPTPSMISGSGSASKDGGLKFTYESQTGGPPVMANPSISPSPLSMDPVLKESPPSSPGSEAGSSRKRGRKSAESKDNVKPFFHNGLHATHMLGNHLNPNSSVAQKMSDQLNMELEAHSAYTQPSDVIPQLVGVPLPGKGIQMRNPTQSNSTNSLSSMLSGAGTISATGNTPQSLEQLLERQWEQGSQFLMEQAQHFDIASLLSCLHQLRTENVRLEDHVNNLIARRDHLLAVNARLAIPLNPAVPPNTTLNNMHMNGPTSDTTSSRVPRVNAHYAQLQASLPVENGIDFRHSSHPATTNNNPSSLSRHSSANLNYSSSTTSSIHNQQSQHSVLPSAPTSSSASSNSRQQQQQLPQQPSHTQQQQQQHQQQPPLLHSQHSQQSQSSATSSSGSSSIISAQQSLADSHPHARGSSGGGITGNRGAIGGAAATGISGISGSSLSSNSSTIGGGGGSGMVGAVGIGGGGGGGNIGASSYHNATQQSAAYSTVHQSQLRRDDSHAKPS